RARQFLWMLAPDPIAKKQDNGKQATGIAENLLREGLNVTDVGKLIYKVLGEHTQVTASGNLFLEAEKYVSEVVDPEVMVSGATDPGASKPEEPSVPAFSAPDSSLIIRGYSGS